MCCTDGDALGLNVCFPVAEVKPSSSGEVWAALPRRRAGKPGVPWALADGLGLNVCFPVAKVKPSSSGEVWAALPRRRETRSPLGVSWWLGVQWSCIRSLLLKAMCGGSRGILAARRVHVDLLHCSVVTVEISRLGIHTRTSASCSCTNLLSRFLISTVYRSWNSTIVSIALLDYANCSIQRHSVAHWNIDGCWSTFVDAGYSNDAGLALSNHWSHASVLAKVFDIVLRMPKGSKRRKC